MAVIKKHIFNISLLLILLVSGILCVFALANYQGRTATAQNNNESSIYLQGELKQPSDMTDQTTGDGSKVSVYMDQTPRQSDLILSRKPQRIRKIIDLMALMVLPMYILINITKNII